MVTYDLSLSVINTFSVIHLFVHARMYVYVCCIINNIHTIMARNTQGFLWEFFAINKSQCTGRLRMPVTLTVHGSHCSADMIKGMVKYVEEQNHGGCDDTPAATTSHGSDKASSGSSVSPLMSFVMANDTNYKQKLYKPLLKRPTAGS